MDSKQIERVKKFLTPRVVVNCRTKGEHDEFLKIAEAVGIRWISGSKPTCLNCFNIYTDRTCFRVFGFSMKFGSVDFYIENNYEIFTFPRFLERIKPSKNGGYPVISEHLIRGNKTIIKLSDGKVGIAKCNPEDEFSVIVGATVALARAFGKTANVVDGLDDLVAFKKGKFKVGDKVRVVNGGCQYAMYDAWFDYHDFKGLKKLYKMWIRNDYLADGDVVVVKAKGVHSEDNSKMLYAIQPLGRKGLYLIDEDGLEKM